MGGYSIELCGGTHLDNTAKIGLFKIISEYSVASGVRRIEGVTGLNVLELLKEKENLINETAIPLKANNPNEIADKANSLANDFKNLSRTIAELNQKMANQKTDELISSAKTVGDFKIISEIIDNSSLEALRVLGDTIKDKLPSAVALLSTIEEDKISFVCVCGKTAVKLGANAGNIVREAAKITGGGGGGKPDSATAGGKDKTKLNSAHQVIFALLQK